MPYGHGALFKLLGTDHQHVGHLLLLGPPDLGAHALRLLVEADPEVGRAQGIMHALRVRQFLLGQRNHAHLLRGQPEREGATVVLDQDTEETLQAAQQGAMHHVGPVFLSIIPHIIQVEALGQVEIELDRRELPLASDRILDLEIDLGAVERAAALVRLVGHPLGLEGLLERLGGRAPVRLLAHRLGRARGQVGRDVIKTEGRQNA